MEFSCADLVGLRHASGRVQSGRDTSAAAKGDAADHRSRRERSRAEDTGRRFQSSGATPPATTPAPAAPTSSAKPATPATPVSTPTTNPTPVATAPMKTPAYLANVPLISRQVLFGNPDKAAVRSSPDGKRISYLASVNNVMNVFVGPIDDPAAAKPVTKDTKRGIRSYFWAYSNQHILYVQDNEGDENFHVYARTSTRSRPVT